MTTNEDLLQKTFEILKKANSKIEQLESERSEPIAIIGMACRFPGGANTLEDFWRILERGGDVITEIPKTAGTWKITMIPTLKQSVK